MTKVYTNITGSLACIALLASACGTEEFSDRAEEPAPAADSLDATAAGAPPPVPHEHDDTGQMIPPPPSGPSPAPKKTNAAATLGTEPPTKAAMEPDEPMEQIVESPIVEFRIAAGTGARPWNSESETLELKVGQTLRLINDDNVPHRLHTNGAPCRHGTAFAPGATFDCQLTRAFDPKAASGPLYDHIAGRRAQFWLRVK
jgi:hypothetical protein